MQNDKCKVRPEVLTYDDVRSWVPALDGHRKLVEGVFHALWIDRVNEVHSRWCADTGVDFAHRLVEDEFKIDLKVDGVEVLKSFPTGPFITVSNHPFGGMDGIILLHLLGKYRPDYKVMVNMFLNNIRAMQPAFIAVDPSQSDDPEKKMMTLKGIREAMKRIRDGHPVGFFPAGAVSKIDRSLHIRDRQWQPSIIRLISQMKVPVIPVYFHGHNSTFFNILGLIDWRIRTLRLPREVFLMRNRMVHVSIGEPISVERQAECADMEQLGKLLRESTYNLEHKKWQTQE